MSNSMKSLCIVLLLFACGRLSAQNQEHRARNVVLVHGAWADGSGWKGVYDILVKDGYNVSIVQEPETSFKEDVAATKRTLALQNGPCIFVARGRSSGRLFVRLYAFGPVQETSSNVHVGDDNSD